jgi:hypothetical protein
MCSGDGPIRWQQQAHALVPPFATLAVAFGVRPPVKTTSLLLAQYLQACFRRRLGVLGSAPVLAMPFVQYRRLVGVLLLSRDG